VVKTSLLAFLAQRYTSWDWPESHGDLITWPNCS